MHIFIVTVGYHDFNAYTQRLANGKYQGFVLVQHHTFTETVQTVFRAGKPAGAESEAFANAESKAAQLVGIAYPP